ncbi:hypothetical protein ES707_18159 [subsurface metagenome]
MTSIWTEEEYEDFAGTIQKEGIHQPIKCILDDTTYWLVDGLHRLDEARRKGIEKVPVVYKEGKLVDALVENLVSNRLRGKTPASDEVKLIRHLRLEYQMEPWQIAEKTGLPRARIEQRLQIGTAAPEVLSCLEFDQIPLGVAYHLSRLPNQSGQIALLSRLLQATPPARVSEVEEIIDHAIEIQKEMLNPHEEPIAEIPLKTISCHLCGERYEAQDMRGINVCATCHGLSRDFIQRRKAGRTASITPEQALAHRVATDDDIEKARADLEKAREERSS